MNIPEKLPEVSGVGPINKGFRMAFGAINQIIDYLLHLTPRPSNRVKLIHTSKGFTFEPGAFTADDNTDTGDARWQ